MRYWWNHVYFYDLIRTDGFSVELLTIVGVSKSEAVCYLTNVQCSCIAFTAHLLSLDCGIPDSFVVDPRTKAHCYYTWSHDCLDSSMCRYDIPYDKKCSNAFLINLEGNPVSINNLKVDSWLKEDEKAAVNDRPTQLESLLQPDTFVLNWLQKSFFKRFDTSAATTSLISTNSLSSTSDIMWWPKYMNLII